MATKARKAGRSTGKLTALAVAKMTTPGLHADGGNLYLKVDENGNKSWIFRYTAGGKKPKVGLGPLHTVTLAEAREKASEQRKLLQAGQDPVAVKREAKAAVKLAAAQAKTFDEVTAEYIKTRSSNWTNPKHRKQWAKTLATYASPVIGKKPISEIDTADVLKVLAPIWTSKNETASRVRQRIETVMAAAKVLGYRSGENPALWRNHLDKLLPDRSKVRTVEHHAALPYSELPGFMGELKARPAIAARALEFAILSAGRTNEVLGATWSEIDFDARLWTIPKERMKAGREHRVPLSAAALAVLEAMKAERVGDYIFPGAKRRRPLSNMSMLLLLRRMKRRDLTAHGFRSCFRTWTAERTTFPREVAEAALAHVIENDVEAAYQRGDLLKKRRQLMDAWGRYATGSKPAAKVIAFPSKVSEAV